MVQKYSLRDFIRYFFIALCPNATYASFTALYAFNILQMCVLAGEKLDSLEEEEAGRMKEEDTRGIFFTSLIHQIKSNSENTNGGQVTSLLFTYFQVQGRPAIHGQHLDNSCMVRDHWLSTNKLQIVLSSQAFNLNWNQAQLMNDRIVDT